MNKSRNELSDAEFRDRLRTWLAQIYPQRWRDASRRLRGEDARWWMRVQYEAGWRAPSWPREHGGLGLSIRKQIIYQQEMERFGVARALDHGVRMIGPILMRHGTPSQCKTYLQPILRGSHEWCQGYSEPGAGSDLANLKTAARASGEHFVIRGRKIWTTHAADASHIYLLARTSSGGRKQEGITLFLVEMQMPGIKLRSIRNLGGEEEFYEVSFDDVIVSRDDVVGTVDDGWRIAKDLLGFERFSQGSPALARYAMDVAQRIARILHLADEGAYVDRLARLACDVHDAAALYDDLCEAVAAGEEPQNEYSMAKLVSAELLQRITECMMDLLGEAAQRNSSALGNPLRETAERLFWIARSVTIFGGTSEVQRNILGKSLLR